MKSLANTKRTRILLHRGQAPAKVLITVQKSSSIVQVQGLRTGHELLLTCSRTVQLHFMCVKLGKVLSSLEGKTR